MTYVPGIVAPSGALPCTWFLLRDGHLVVRSDASGVALPGDGDLTSLALERSSAHYLGVLDGRHVFATALEVDPPENLALRSLRSLFGALDEERLAVAGRAVQIVEWASTHHFCGRCATPTEHVHDERALRCPACQLVAYPRISPAVIVLVRRGKEALLARGARFPLPFYSTLAGFSEVGESLEETLVREVREEVGIEVTNIRYFGSQPWPFPHSLMIGFLADHRGGEIQIDQKEIVDAGWYAADALPLVPPGFSIARKLIDSWVAEVSS